MLHPNYFLFIVGIFTVYLVGTGYRFVYLKMSGKDQSATMIDWTITICMVIAGVLFIVLGLGRLIKSDNFGIVLLVFGSLGLFFTKTDIDNYRGKSKAMNYWLLVHLQRMTGAYIAAVTAFLVVNAKYSPVEMPSVVYWLLPTAVLTPLIISWTKKYKVKSAATPVRNEKDRV